LFERRQSGALDERLSTLRPDAGVTLRDRRVQPTFAFVERHRVEGLLDALPYVSVKLGQRRLPLRDPKQPGEPPVFALRRPAPGALAEQERADALLRPVAVHYVPKPGAVPFPKDAPRLVQKGLDESIPLAADPELDRHL